MNQLSTAERAKVISVLVEGNSLRATARITGVARMTVEKLLRDLGTACSAFHNEHVRNIRTQRIQCDEIWSFVGAKERNVTPEQKAQGWGDIWTWTALDPDTKLMVSWFVGHRDATSAWWFMRDLCSRLISRVQLTTDGHYAYLTAVQNAFADEIDFAQLIKIYGQPREGAARYSPARFKAAQRAIVSGNPDPKHISTSHVERQNLTMRMGMRRFTRLTNGFSKKAEMHALNIALHFTHYNFCRVHQTLRVTPAMEAGLSDHVWSIEELVGLLEPTQAHQAASA